MVSTEKIRKGIQISANKTRKRVQEHGIVIPGWIQLVIWLIGAIILTSVTVTFSLPLVINYLADEQNVAVKTTIVVNEKYEKPVMMVSVPFTPNEWNRQYSLISDNVNNKTADDPLKCPQCFDMANASWDVWRHMNLTNDTDRDAYPNTLVAPFMRQLLSNIERGDIGSLSENYSNWNIPVLAAAFYFFNFKYHWDLMLANLTSDRYSGIAAVDEEYSTRYWNKTHVYDIMHLHVTRELCRREINLERFSFNGTSTKDASCEDILLKSKLPYNVYNNKIYIPLESGDSVITTYKWLMAPGTQTTDEFISFYAEPSNLYETLMDTSWARDLGHSMAFAGLANGTWSQFTIFYSAVIRTKENRTNQLLSCSKETNPQMCLMKCTKSWIRQRCACQPFTYRKGFAPGKDQLTLDIIPYCTDKSYNACDPIKHFTNTDLEECRQSCYHPCEYISYSHTAVVREWPVLQGQPSGFEVVLTQVVNPFIQFSNSTKDHPEEIISQVGGMLGLWLGLSGLSILKFVLTVTDFTKRKQKIRKARRKKHSWAISLFRHHYFGLAFLSTMISKRSSDIKNSDNGKDDEKDNKNDNSDNDDDKIGEDQDEEENEEQGNDGSSQTNVQTDNADNTMGTSRQKDMNMVSRKELIRLKERLINEIGRMNEVVQEQSEANREQAKILQDHSKIIQQLSEMLQKQHDSNGVHTLLIPSDL